MDIKKPIRYIYVLFPLCFAFPRLFNAFFFYIGFGFEENVVREYGFIFCCILFAICCGLTFLWSIKKKQPSAGSYFRWAGVMLFFCICGCVGLWKFDFESHLVKYAELFITLVIPSFLMGICAALWGWEDRFFPTLERIGFFAVPCAVIYFNGVLFDCLPWGEKYLGVLRYQDLGYLFMPFLLAYVVGSTDRGALQLPFSGRTVKHPRMARAVLIGVLWLAIIASGTRAIYICVIIFAGLLALSGWLHREESAKTAVVIFLVLAGLLAAIYACAPLGLDRVPQRVQATGKSLTTQVSIPLRDDGTWEETDREICDSLQEVEVISRGTMYTLALREFLHAPLFGMGPGGYTVKYGSYPHNAVLEFLCETGAVGMAVIGALVIWAAVRILRAGQKRREVRRLLIFFLIYAVQANISGCVWQCTALLCALGYGLTVPVEQSPVSGEDKKVAPLLCNARNLTDERTRKKSREVRQK